MLPGLLANHQHHSARIGGSFCAAGCRRRSYAASRKLWKTAVGAEMSAAEQQGVIIQTSVDKALELPLEPRPDGARVSQPDLITRLEAMPAAAARIEIHAERNSHEVLIHVKDTGPGVPAAIRQRCCSSRLRRRARMVLGLGLALSRQTVLDHGGDLWLESEIAPGAHFCMRLPL